MMVITVSLCGISALARAVQISYRVQARHFPQAAEECNARAGKKKSNMDGGQGS
jgi:hypothetical protein